MAPHSIETARLVIRRPSANDAAAIFDRYAGDRDVTRYISWPAHTSVADTEAFLAFADAQWERWPAGPYLIFSKADGTLLGGTGLACETPYRAATGYVLARDAWGRGYATEALRAMVEIARAAPVRRLYALCHAEHRASAHVLEKCEFGKEGVLRRYARFPNLPGDEPCDVLCYARIL
jgi:RimJ/RimL family protein N-acetyltransferase